MELYGFVLLFSGGTVINGEILCLGAIKQLYSSLLQVVRMYLMSINPEVTCPQYQVSL